MVLNKIKKTQKSDYAQKMIFNDKMNIVFSKKDYHKRG